MLASMVKPVAAKAESTSNVLHLTSWLSRQGGGIPPVIWALAGESRRLGMEATVAGLRDGFLEADYSRHDVPMLAGSVVGPGGFGFSSELRNLVANHEAAGGVVHTHGLWMYPGVLARNKSRESACPLVISPHGMLEPWALNRSPWKKRLAGFLFENHNLRAAQCLHALCVPEAKNFRRYGLRNPIAIIPNGINLDELHPLPDRKALAQQIPRVEDKRRILFLSRLHPKKGLRNLLRAWQRLASQFDDWCLIIAGPDEIGHEQELKSLARNLCLEKSVMFVGPAYGESKRQLLAGADLFVLPSFSEGFSMAILEAAAAGLPVLLTHECNFPELAAAGAAVEISPNQSDVEIGLRQLLELSDPQRTTMGRRGSELVARSYAWPVIARQMLEVYDWLLGNRPAPELVKMGEIESSTSACR
jgi:glycosyltransferase involved in cell wall biosynthesis